MSYKHTEELNVIMTPDNSAVQGFRVELLPDRWICLINDDQVNIGKHDVSAELILPSHQELTQRTIDTLRNKQREVAAEAYRKEQELEERIQSLLVLTHQG